MSCDDDDNNNNRKLPASYLLCVAYILSVG